jgi:uncharacterized membrane protein AbrB (regulator of aidB expression)
MFLFGFSMASTDEVMIEGSDAVLMVLAVPVMYALTGLVLFIPWLVGSGLVAGFCIWGVLRSNASRDAQLTIAAVLGAVVGSSLVGIAYWRYAPGLEGVVPVSALVLALAAAVYGAFCGYAYLRRHNSEADPDIRTEKG